MPPASQAGKALADSTFVAPTIQKQHSNSGLRSQGSQLYLCLSLSPAGISMVWLAHQPSPRRLGHIGKLHAVNPPILIHTYGHTRNSNTHKLMDKLTAPTTPPPILLGTGPWIGDMWLGKMRHDAGLSVRQILCLSACLQITSLERLTKTEKEFCFLPF